MTKNRHGRFSDEFNYLDIVSREPRTHRQITKDTQKRAARRLAAPEQQKRLVAFFDALDRAHDKLHGNNEKQAVLEALEAVSRLVGTTGENRGGHYSGIFDRLRDNIKNRQAMGEKSLLGPVGGGAGGVARDSQGHRVKAGTAFLVEYLKKKCGQKRKVRNFCLDAARILSERGFVFSGSKANPKGQKTLTKDVIKARAGTIEMWRRGFRTGDGGEAGELFRRYDKNPPFACGADARDNAINALTWWYELVSKRV